MDDEDQLSRIETFLRDSQHSWGNSASIAGTLRPIHERRDYRSLLSGFDVAHCRRFHEAGDTAQYVLDEILTLGEPSLELNMTAFCYLLKDSDAAVEQASFVACFDFFMDITRRSTNMVPAHGTGDLLDFKESFARELLIQAVASRRPSVKLQKMEHALQLISDRTDASSADDLLSSLVRIVPTVPLIHETVILMRSYIEIRGDPEMLLGPVGYALTSIETALGTS